MWNLTSSVLDGSTCTRTHFLRGSWIWPQSCFIWPRTFAISKMVIGDTRTRRVLGNVLQLWWFNFCLNSIFEENLYPNREFWNSHSWHWDDLWSSWLLCLSLHLPLSLNKLDESGGLLWPQSWVCRPWWCLWLLDQVWLLLWDRHLCLSLFSVLEDGYESDISSQLKCDGL